LRCLEGTLWQGSMSASRTHARDIPSFLTTRAPDPIVSRRWQLVDRGLVTAPSSTNTLRKAWKGDRGRFQAVSFIRAGADRGSMRLQRWEHSLPVCGRFTPEKCVWAWRGASRGQFQFFLLSAAVFARSWGESFTPPKIAPSRFPAPGGRSRRGGAARPRRLNHAGCRKQK